MNKEKLLEWLRKKKKELSGPGGCSVLHEAISAEKVKLIREIIQHIQSEPEETLHDIIYDFITQYDDKIGFAIATQDYDIINDSIKDYLDEPIREKTNFDIITESPEKLAHWIKVLSEARTVIYPKTGITFNDNGLIEWLNQKAGE